VRRLCSPFHYIFSFHRSQRWVGASRARVKGIARQQVAEAYPGGQEVIIVLLRLGINEEMRTGHGCVRGFEWRCEESASACPVYDETPHQDGGKEKVGMERGVGAGKRGCRWRMGRKDSKVKEKEKCGNEARRTTHDVKGEPCVIIQRLRVRRRASGCVRGGEASWFEVPVRRRVSNTECMSGAGSNQ
jgi:hypothetical protein